MKKDKILIGAIIGILVIIIAIVAAMFATGKFDVFKKEETTEITTIPVTETTTETSATGRPKTPVPSSIVAAVYSDYSENSNSELASFAKLGFNTVIFELNKENTDKVAALLETAKALNLYYGVRADISEKSDYAVSFIEKHNADFIILSGLDETIGNYFSLMTETCEKIKSIDSVMQTGIEPVYVSKTSAPLIMLTSLGKADFVFLSHDSSQNSAFETAQTLWNEKTSPLWICHDLKGISSYSTDKASKMIETVSKSADMSLCRGLAFMPYSEISKASGTSAEIVLNYIQKRDTYLLDKEFKITNHQKTSFTVEQSSVTFRGTSSPAYDLICNGQKMTVAKTGDFSVDCQLSPGKNTIKFEHKGKTYNYEVTYKIKLLKSVSPSEDISVPSEMMIEVSAVAHKKATLTVTWNGKNYPMSLADSGNEEDTVDKESDFGTFTASLTAPKGTDKVQKLGKYKITAKYSGLTETMNGASISVSANEIVIPPPPPTEKPTTTTTTQKPTEAASETASETNASPSESGTAIQDNSTQTTEKETTVSTQQTPTLSDKDRLQKYFYTENYGLGTATICEIIEDYVEAYPGNTTSTFSVPDCSPLLKGTVDYVKTSSTFDGDKYYILSSGIKVAQQREERLASGKEGAITHVSIKSGYVMPKNSIKVVSSSTSNGNTVIKLDMNRTVAFNAKLLGQTYSNYNSRPVRVSSLNCTGIEFVFSDTVNAEGKINVSNGVCAGGKWTSDSSKSTVTLTLELASKGKFYGFHYEYDKDGYLVITIKHKPSSSLSGYTIMLDPGHGGIDPGAICAVTSSSFGNEKDINLSLATKIKDLLEAEGAKVIMTRTTDKWVCYTDRNAAVRNSEPDMFIAVHCDSSNTASAMGTSAYYYRAYSQPLAKAVHESIVKAYKTKIYADKPESTLSKVSRGSDFYAFRVTRVEECPAILIEYGFVSNISECQVLQDAGNRDILAAATVEGIKNYISAS
ncbi:MAG: N-acetylmuramoyl-L-alanine amidase [Clostridia bacterium]|nr:N-acetylmuramoyl-L-alanine amidase [Clostridia bacterium]